MAKAARKLVVVVVSAGGVDLDERAANAVVWAPYGGEEAGSGLADVIFGRVNPSARLPVTVYTQSWFEAMAGDVATSILNLDLDAGHGRTHRYIKDDARDVKHYFGFGLSYTSFAYSGLRVAREGLGVEVSVTVRNTGRRAGAEVVQVYISGAKPDGVPAPAANLVGFVKVGIPAAASATATVHVPAEQLQTALADGTRAVLPGKYTVWAGGHHPADKEGEAASGPCVSTILTL